MRLLLHQIIINQHQNVIDWSCQQEKKAFFFSIQIGVSVVRHATSEIRVQNTTIRRVRLDSSREIYK